MLHWYNDRRYDGFGSVVPEGKSTSYSRRDFWRLLHQSTLVDSLVGDDYFDNYIWAEHDGEVFDPIVMDGKEVPNYNFEGFTSSNYLTVESPLTKDYNDSRLRSLLLSLYKLERQKKIYL